MESKEQDRPKQDEEPIPPRKEYSTPRLTVHGTVDKLTGTTDQSDFFTVVSDRGLKQGFGAVDGSDVLARLATVPVQTWSYKSQDTSVRHIGPMAQDFAAAFGVGEDDRHINLVDT